MLKHLLRPDWRIRTPVSGTVTLSATELKCLYALREAFAATGSLDELAISHGVSLQRYDGFLHARAAIMWERDCAPEIWIKPESELSDKISFAHELHHLLFAPEMVAGSKRTRDEVARCEAHATLFGALFAIPSMDEFQTEEDIYRIFGPSNAPCAHYWIAYYKKTRLEV